MSTDSCSEEKAPRLCVLLASLNAGGVEMNTLRLCRRYVENGCRVDLFYWRSGLHSLESKVPDGVHAVPFRDLHRRVLREKERSLLNLLSFRFFRYPLRVFSALRHIYTDIMRNWLNFRAISSALLFRQAFRFSRYAAYLSFYIDAQKPETIFVWGYNLYPAAALALQMTSCKPFLVNSLHGSLHHQIKGDIKEWMAHFLSETDRVHVVSQGLNDEFCGLFDPSPGQVVTLHNPAVPEGVSSLRKASLQYPWGEEKYSGKLILAVGRIAEEKSYPDLLRAVQMVCKKQDVRLIILGAGKTSSVSSLKKLCHDFGIANRVFFPGFVSNPFPWLRAADVFVLSSKHEGLPTVLVEALACACRIVSTDCPHGPREILEDGHLGRLVPVGDIKALAAAIEETLEHPVASARQLLGRARDFREETLVPQYMDLLRLSGNTDGI